MLIISPAEGSNSSDLAKKLTEVSNPLHFDHLGWSQLYAQWIISTYGEGLSMEEVADEEPGMTIEDNLAFLQMCKPLLHNFGQNFHVEGIDDGRVAWLVEAEKREPEDPVLVYCHGGGYLHGLIPIFPSFLKELHQHAANKDRLSVLIVEYTLAWQGGKWPKPVDEVTRTLNTLSSSCKNFFIGGDSAGAHLCLSTLRHTVYSIQGVVEAIEKPSGVLLISPWINMHPPTTGSYDTNKPPRDVCNSHSLNGYGRMISNNEREQFSKAFNPALDDEADWSKILPPKKLIYYGDREVMVDDVERWIKELARISEDDVFVDEDAVHIDVILDTFGRRDALERLAAFVSQF